MKTINRTVGDVLREVAAAASHVGRYAMRTLSRMSWPALLASCVALAFLLTILPLALTLFVIFLLVKIAIALVAGYSYNKRRGNATPHKDV
jgi:hypothetical protein